MINKKVAYLPTGHLEIYKVFEDIREDELIFEEQNTITSGLGVGLSLLFGGQGSQIITDYQLRWFQLGVSGDVDNYGVSTNALGSAIDVEANYLTEGSRLIVHTHDQLVNGTTLNNKVFAEIPFYAIHKTSKTSVRFMIRVDKNSCNTTPSMDLNEIGLFMANPRGQDTLESILVAYRPHTAITKTDDFALLYIWEINF